MPRPADFPSENPPTHLQRWAIAMGKVAGKRGVYSPDESRRGVEQLPVEDYDTLGYFERWAASVLSILPRKRPEDVRKRPLPSPEDLAVPPRFAAGTEVLVADLEPPTFHRTPGYLKGRRGTVIRAEGVFPNPESLGEGGDGLPPAMLYTVGFRMGDLWPDARHPDDRVRAGVYEHWMEPI